MRKRRSVIVVLASGVVVAGLAAAVVGFCWPRLPDPATADRDGLLRWLVTRDLGQEPSETRLLLARRLEQQFSGTIDWAAVGQRLDGQQRDRLWDNVLLLLEPWFADKVDGYFRLQESQRPAYVDRTLQQIENWKGATLLSAQSATGPQHGERSGLIELLIERVGRWMESVTPQRREQVRQFLLAVQCRWLQGAILGEGPTKAL